MAGKPKHKAVKVVRRTKKKSDVTYSHSVEHSGLAKKTREEIGRLFTDKETGKVYPLVDATAPLLLIPNDEDRACAVRGNPRDCALAQTSKRVYGSTGVVIDNTRAFADHLDEDGVRRLHRYIIRPKTRDAIKIFDDGGSFPIAGFTLEPPKGSYLLTEVRRKAALKRKEIKEGKRTPKPGKKRAKRAGLQAGTFKRETVRVKSAADLRKAA